MRDLRSALGSDKRGEAGIAEEVEQRGRAAGGVKPLPHERPMRLLLGKNADMAEGGEAAGEVDGAMAARPCLPHAGTALPASGALLVEVAGESRVGTLPFVRGEFPRPHRLFLRAI